MKPISRVLATAAMALCVSACGQDASQTSQDQQPPASQAAPAGAVASNAPPAPAPEAAPAIPPATELQIDRVQSVQVSRLPDTPTSLMIRVSGNVVSAGWTAPKLAPVEDAGADGKIKVFSFVATSPEMPGEERAPQAVETELRIDDLPAEVRTIRIVSATNAINAPVIQ